jgi:hypothetical protein
MKTRAAGVGKMLYTSFFGRDELIDFWVYKVDDEPRRLPEKWSHFCSRAPDVTRVDVDADVNVQGDANKEKAIDVLGL